MSTALTLYLQELNASSTLSTANQLIENGSTTSSNTNKNSNATVGTTGWIEVYSQGNGTTVSGAGSQPSPSGHGWFDDGTTLEANHYDTGTWTATIRMSLSAGSCTADLHVRAYRYHSSAYTLIAEMVATGQSLTTTQANFTCTATGVAASATFATGDKTYIDITANITASSSGGNLKIQESSSGTQGYTSAQVVTPGYLASTQIDKDVAIRGRISAQVSKDLALRGRLSQQTQKNLALRGNVGLVSKRDLALRGRISAQVQKDLTLRGRISQLTSGRDLALRGRTANTVGKNIVLRGNITGPPLTSGGFTLFGNGTGTIQYDSFRVTEYPDPSLSLAPILPRVGATAVEWNALTPANTTLGTDISYDGVNWTDVTSGNGGSLPSIYSQPDPTSDAFSTNTSANYTSTFRTGGGTGTWTYDTANSRIVATGGTNALYVYNAISRADVDFFADLDRSDAGGIVWRYNDQSNFYYLLIGDSLASSGTQNTITLYKVASNVQTQLGTATISYTVGTPADQYTVLFTRGTYRRFRVTMLTGAITVYVDGISMITYTDGSPLSAGKVGLFNNAGTTGSRYYQLWIQPQGDYVSGTPQGDIVTSKFVYTRQRLSTTDPTETPQVEDITTLATNPEIGAGISIPSVTYNYTFISKNFDDLAKQCNYSWYIDPSKTLIFRSYQAIPSPWILQSAPAGLVNNVDLEVSSNLELDVGNDLYRNRQTILGAQDVTSTQAAFFVGDGSTRTFTLGYPLAAKPTIVVDGITQTSVALKGNTGFAWYYALDDPVLQQDASQPVLQSTDQLVVTYTGLVDVVVTVDDTAEQTSKELIEGGTGIVEDVEDHTSDVPRMSKATALVLAQQLINRYAVAGRTLIFDTSRNGLAIGQVLSIFLIEQGIWDGQFFITQIEITLRKGINDTQVWWYKVTASELPKQASWAKLIASGLQLQTNWTTS